MRPEAGLLALLALAADGLRLSSPSEPKGVQESYAVSRRIASLAEAANCTQEYWASFHEEDASVALSFEEPQRPRVPRSPYATSIPVFYITNGGDREQEFSEMFKDFSPQFQRIEAVDGADHSHISSLITRADETLSRLQSMGTPSQIIGCLLSHILAIRSAYESGAEAALILEDDAVPLVPWWPVSLEEFVLSLPSKWQAAQVQWSANLNKTEEVRDDSGGNSTQWGSVRKQFSELLMEKRGNSSSSRLYHADTGWGTAAYLISKEGMKRVIADTWDPRKKRFSVIGMLAFCKKFSADDCLLGFTDSISLKTRKDVHLAATIKHSHTYRATPPFFMHGSTRTQAHQENVCVDFMAVATAKRREPLTTTTEEQRRQLLLWTPVELEATKVRRLLGNIQHARESAGLACCDAFLDFDVSHTSPRGEPAPDRFDLLRANYEKFATLWESKYDYIWVLDPYQEIVAENISKVLGTVRRSAALIAQPLAEQGPSCGGEDAACLFHANSSVSLAAPLIRMVALKSFLERVALERMGGGKQLDCSAPLLPGVATELWRESLEADGETGRVPSAKNQCIVLNAVVRSAQGQQ